MLDKTESFSGNYLEYKRLIKENDIDIPFLLQMHKTPEISRFLSIDENNYFSYVANTANVYFYKVYEDNKLIGELHLETEGLTLYMSIAVFPEFQKMGFGTLMLEDIKNGVFNIDYDRIEISIDERNTASLKLFENVGFIPISKDGELLNYVYEKRKRNGQIPI